MLSEDITEKLAHRYHNSRRQEDVNPKQKPNKNSNAYKGV